VDARDPPTAAGPSPLSFPPKAFVTRPFFAAAKAALAAPAADGSPGATVTVSGGSALVMNIACRSPPLLAGILAGARREFGDEAVALVDMRDEAGGVNVVLVATVGATIPPPGTAAATPSAKASALAAGRAALAAAVADKAAAAAADSWVTEWIGGCLVASA
jgi:hypothetical protein